ncbi:MAG: dihydroxyacetone kinase subunit L [Candidatus Lokiarchaeota archaeon]|nr:dihydroxyacetone kinase subunit L [Candidatus Lokiarchaeota archaeon]
MPKNTLSVAETKEMFLYIAEKIIDSKDQLTEADKKIGDGDHGVNMARGFEAVHDKLSIKDYDSIGDLINDIGMTILTSVGGAAGAIFGTWFRSGAKNLIDKTEFDTEALIFLLSDGLKAIKKRGKVHLGDKTLVDALEPASEKAKELREESLNIVIKETVKSAREGKEQTKEMVAKLGKAKSLGERSLGFADPGAISTYLILYFMEIFVNNELN